MTDQPDHTDHGFLTSQTRAYLNDEDTDSEDPSEELATQLQAALDDLKTVWHLMPEDDLVAFASCERDEPERQLRTAVETALAFLYRVSQLNGDDVTFRLQEAIKTAERSRGQRATVDISIHTSAMLSPQEVLARLDQEGSDETLSYHELDQLWLANDVDAERVAEWTTKIDPEAEFEETLAGIRAEREASRHIVRYPTPTVVDVEQVSNSDDLTPDTSGDGA